jgi:hypothetical protein
MWDLPGIFRTRTFSANLTVDASELRQDNDGQLSEEQLSSDVIEDNEEIDSSRLIGRLMLRSFLREARIDLESSRGAILTLVPCSWFIVE